MTADEQTEGTEVNEGREGTPGEPAAQESATRVLTAAAYAELTQRATQAQEFWDRLLRLQAEFDNARKRMRKEQMEFERRANERVLGELLGIVDDFERALAATEGAGVVHPPLAAAATEGTEGADPSHLKTGMKMIYRRLAALLKAHGVEPIATTGHPFDPTRHEAVAHVATTEHPAEKTGGGATVIEELRKGYTLHGRVMRPATVKVAVKKAADG